MHQPLLEIGTSDSPGDEATNYPEQPSACEEFLASAGKHKTSIVMLMILIVTVVLLSVDIDESRPNASKGALVLIVTGTVWFSEIVPLTVGALLPIALYPLFGVTSSKMLATKFFTNGFELDLSLPTSVSPPTGHCCSIVAVRGWIPHRPRYRALEPPRTHCLLGGLPHRGETGVSGWRLHVRRHKPPPDLRCLSTLMLRTSPAAWFMSMWMSNTAAVLCLVPVTEVICLSSAWSPPSFPPC